MRDLLFGNSLIKLFSLIVAILIWLYVQSDEVSTGQVRATVEWHLPNGIVSVEPLPTMIALRVRGTRAAIRRATLESDLIRIPIDLPEVSPGTVNIELESYAISGLHSGLEVLSRSPSGIRLNLDRQVRRKLQVTPRIVGTPADGFMMQQARVVPSVVEVTGPASVLQNLEDLQTVAVDIDGRSEDLEIPTMLILPRNVQAPQDLAFQANVKLLATRAQRTFDAVPVRIWGRNVSPEPAVAMVELTGPNDVLKRLDPLDLVVFVQEPEIRTGPYRVTWGQEGPARVRVLHGGGAGVEATLVEPSTFEVNR